MDKVCGDKGIGYYNIIGHYIMVQLGLKSDFGCQILEWDNTMVPMKILVNLLVQPGLTKRNIQEVIVQTAEPYSTREATERVLKMLNSTYVKADLDKVDAAAVQIDKYQRKTLLLLLT